MYTNQNNNGSYPYDAEIRSFGGGGAPNQGGFPEGGEPIYPGLGGNPYGEVVRPGGFGSSPNLPAVTGGTGAGTGSGGIGGLLGNFNFGQLKGLVDRLGGIDGVIGTMGKVQKMMASFQQMAPMLKVLIGAFGSKAATKNAGRLSAGSRKRRKRRAPQVRRAGGRRRYGSRGRPRR
jgi:hypothetical protein